MSIWLDDLSRERITSGNLAELIADRNVVGVTTNPTIFAGALSKGDAYRAQLHALAEAGADLDDAIFEATTDDVRDAADIFRPVYDASGGVDGRVSIEVSPDLAHDTDATIEQAKELWDKVDRPNVLIKIPATMDGPRRDHRGDRRGHQRQRHADLQPRALRRGHRRRTSPASSRRRRPASTSRTIHSVASFFVSRVDTEIDKRLTAIGTDEALALKSKAGIANARLAYELYEEVFAGERAKALLDAGANRQRPLWASTGVKDPSLPDTLYVTELVAPGTVNTMPEKTLEATFDHGEIAGRHRHRRLRRRRRGARLARRASASTSTTSPQVLEDEGVEKFIVSWHELHDTVRTALEAAR